MIVTDILLDGLFAAVAAIGFGAISDPPMRAFPRIALLAAIGHALRFTLMHCSALDIATASLFAAFAIGMGSLWLGRGVRCPMTCLYIPALLPMVPGIYAYKTVFSLIMFLQSLDRADEGMRLHAAVFSQCHRIAECHCAACRRCHAADIHLQAPGLLYDPTHTKK